MKTCYKCGHKVKKAKTIMKDIKLDCLRCPECGEEFFTLKEMFKFDVLTGRRKLVRKFGYLGDSTIIRIPPKILEHYKIKPEDFGAFEERPEGILIRPLSAKELKKL